MSTPIISPSPSFETVNGWTVEDVKIFLETNKVFFSLNDAEISKIEDEGYHGRAFLLVTKEDLLQMNLRRAPATTIVEFVAQYSQKQPDAGLVTLENLDDRIDLIRSELGNVYESTARNEIAKTSGFHYSSKFEIYDLNGLARLSLPRKQFSDEILKYGSPIYIQTNRANKISNYIYDKKMKMNLEESIRYIRSLPQNKKFIKNLNTLANRAEKALNDWEAHEKKHTSAENRLYLANTKFLGVMLITSYIIDPKIAIENNHAPFAEVLELDVRGRSTSYLDMTNVSIEIGEIKLSDKNLYHGYRQLLIRLASLGFAVEALNSKGDKTADYRCDLVGILYLSKVPPVINIQSEWERGIKFPKGSNHTIRIVAVGASGIFFDVKS